MASVNAWADGMSAFKDAYGLVRGIQKTNRTKKIMDDEKFMAEGGAGYGLEGSALEKARYRALGDLETEFGNAEGGLANRRMVQQIEQGDRDNRINDLNEKYRIRMEGELAEKSMLLNQLLTQATTSDRRASAGLKGGQLADLNALRDGKVKLGYATVGLRNAQTANTKSTTARRDALLPGETAQQGATLSYTNAGTDNRKENTNLTREQITQIQKMSDAKLAELVSNTALTDENVARIKALTQPEVDNLVARTDQTKQMTTSERLMMPLRLAGTAQTNLGLSLGNQETAATLDGTVAATNAENALGTNTDQAALASQTAEQNIMAEAAGMEFDTLQAGNDWVISQIEGSGDIGPERKLALVQTLQKHGVTKIAGMSAEIKSAAELAIQAGGLEGLVDYYDTIDDGGSLQVVENSDGTVRVLKNDDFGQTVLMEGPREVVQGQLTAQLTNPSTAMEVAAAALDMQVKRSNIDNTTSTIKLRDEQIKLVRSQTDKVREEIASSKASMPEQKKIAWKGLGEMMGDVEFGLLDPEERRSMQFEYMKTMGMLTENKDGKVVIEMPPTFTDPKMWTPEFAEDFLKMSPEEQALFLEDAGGKPPTADASAGLAGNRAPNRNIPSMSESEVAQAKSLNSEIAPPGVRQSEWDTADRNRKLKLLKNAGGGLSANSTRPSDTANDAGVVTSSLPPSQRPSMPITVDSVTAPPGVRQAEWNKAGKTRRARMIKNAAN